MLGRGRIIPRLTAFKRDSNHFSSSFVFYFSIFFPRGCLYACAHWCHRGTLHRPPSSSPSFICRQEWGKDCHVHVWSGVHTFAASTSTASCSFCPAFLVFFFFCSFSVFSFCLAAAMSASAEGVNSAPNHSARWITPTPMDNHAVK